MIKPDKADAIEKLSDMLGSKLADVCSRKGQFPRAGITYIWRKRAAFLEFFSLWENCVDTSMTIPSYFSLNEQITNVFDHSVY